MLPKEQCGIRMYRSIRDMIFVGLTLLRIGLKVRMALFVYFVDVQKAYDTVDRTLLWQVLTRIGVPPIVTTVIRHFHDDMRAYV